MRGVACRAIQGRAECPICRAPLKPGDLFDAATAEEEESQRLLNENIGNYGAKVRALSGTCPARPALPCSSPALPLGFAINPGNAPSSRGLATR